jgi:hypothetical protein
MYTKFLNTPRSVREQNMVMSSVGLGTKNDCAGEGQQQFSSQPVSQSGTYVYS